MERSEAASPAQRSGSIPEMATDVRRDTVKHICGAGAFPQKRPGFFYYRKSIKSNGIVPGDSGQCSNDGKARGTSSLFNLHHRTDGKPGCGRGISGEAPGVRALPAYVVTPEGFLSTLPHRGMIPEQLTVLSLNAHKQNKTKRQA